MGIVAKVTNEFNISIRLGRKMQKKVKILGLIPVFYRSSLAHLSDISRSTLGQPSVKWLIERGSTEGRPRVERGLRQARARKDRENTE